MNIRFLDKKLERPMGVVSQFIDLNPGLKHGLAHTELEFGLATDHAHCEVPARARLRPAYVGDAAYRGRGARYIADARQIVASEEVRALFKADPSKVDTAFVFDEALGEKGQYRLQAAKRRVADGVMDANANAPALLGMQALSPWNVGWFQKIFKGPLLYSHATDLVEMESGTEPWAEVMNLNLADYVGFATLESSGGLANNVAPNVNVQAGLMVSPVVHMAASYDLSIEELKRAEQSGSPFGQQLVTLKQKYADYVLHMLTSYLIYFGNSATETVGLLNVPSSITSYTGSSMNGIFLNNTTNPGAAMLTGLQSIIIPFLDALYNKAETLVIAMSPVCYNRLTAPYSTTYNPTAALKAMIENLIAGKKEDGSVPNVEIVVDPLLSASTVFNAQTYDYLLLIAPRMRTGPAGEVQPMVMFGAPLMEFVYPTIPGSYDTQYKFLRRVAGVFAPVQAAVAAYSGFGIKSATT